jgi:hypothetical protein
VALGWSKCLSWACQSRDKALLILTKKLKHFFPEFKEPAEIALGEIMTT